MRPFFKIDIHIIQILDRSRLFYHSCLREVAPLTYLQQEEGRYELP